LASFEKDFLYFIYTTEFPAPWSELPADPEHPSPIYTGLPTDYCLNEGITKCLDTYYNIHNVRQHNCS